MPQTNSWLCQYAICQLGRPYWYGTYGQIASEGLYADTVRKSEYYYTDYENDYGQKVHDCSGLVVGALTCDNVDEAPSMSPPIAHGATSQFYYNCEERSENMDDFPFIPGTLVFTTDGDVKKHVGIYVGSFIDKDGEQHTDEVVEAMGHTWGVVTTKIYNDKWDCWGQITCCEVDTKEGQSFDARTVSSASYINSNIELHPELMTPFVATLMPAFNKTLDYDQIKEARISGMMFYGGQLYDNEHNTGTYVNPYLDNLVQDCKNAGMPYALYINVRARSEIEADAECKPLYYIVSKYLPKLGLWLSLNLQDDKELNDKIIEVYYRYFQKWGIEKRCGFYVTPEQLDQITWTSFQDRFYLWEIAPMNVADIDEELLQPEMFEVPD